MAEAFTYDLSTDLGKVRLGLCDTREATAWFSDAEVQHFLDTEGSVNAAVLAGLRKLLVDRARRSRSYSDASGLAYDDTAQVAALQAAIAELIAHDLTLLPAATVAMPAPLPMDDGFDSDDP